MRSPHLVWKTYKAQSVSNLGLSARFFALSFSAEAQQAKKVPRIELLSPQSC
jgi:hypothetical protein